MIRSYTRFRHVARFFKIVLAIRESSEYIDYMRTQITIESEWIDWRKHGRPFIRNMETDSFIEPTHTEWGKKVMKQFFNFSIEEGSLLQIRLRDGSWKNDSKHYVRVAPDGSFVDIDQNEAGRAIAAMKMASQEAK